MSLFHLKHKDSTNQLLVTDISGKVNCTQVSKYHFIYFVIFVGPSSKCKIFIFCCFLMFLAHLMLSCNCCFPWGPLRNDGQMFHCITALPSTLKTDFVFFLDWDKNFSWFKGTVLRTCDTGQRPQSIWLTKGDESVVRGVKYWDYIQKYR